MGVMFFRSTAEPKCRNVHRSVVNVNKGKKRQRVKQQRWQQKAARQRDTNP